MSELPVRGRKLGICHCGRYVPWDDLRIATIPYLQPPAQNRFAFSRYRSPYWTCLATDAGRISEGPFLHEYSIIYDDNNVASETGGSQTWRGHGVLFTTEGIDCSSANELVVAAEVGPYQGNEHASLLVRLEVSSYDPPTLALLREVTINCQTRIWAHIRAWPDGPLPNFNSVRFHFAVTPVANNAWFVDRLQLEFDVKTPGHYLETTGVPQVYDRPTRLTTTARTCSECRRAWKRTRSTTVITPEPIDPIPIDPPPEA